MTLRAQANLDIGAVREKVERLRSRLDSIARREGYEPGKLRGFVDEYYKLVENLGIPKFKLVQLNPRETATFQRLNQIFNDIDEDVAALFREYAGLTTMVAQSYNRSQAILRGAEAELKNATAMTLASSIQGGLVQRGTFSIVEKFDDASRIDPSTTAELGFGGGLTLRKTAVFEIEHGGSKVNIVADDKNPYTDERVQELTASRPGEAAPQKPSINPAYEGRYYALLGEGEFEAGRLKLIPSGDKLVPAPTSQEDLLRARRVMLDGDADTYHQIERTVSNNGQPLDPGKVDNDFPYDFLVEYTVELATLTRATGVVIDPINFGERAWIEIQTMETSRDGQSWESVPSLHDYNYYNVLTDEANKTLTDRQASSILAPSKYDYGGKGLWVFGQREFKYLRFKILQRNPIAQPYEVLQVKQERVVKKTKKAKKVLGIKLGKDSAKTKTESREVELSYEESLKAFSGESVVESGQGSYRADQGLEISFGGHNIFSGGGTSVEKSAWATSGYNTIIKNDVVRYVIGIREVELLAAEFADASVYRSTPFTVASPIRQIQLRADQYIPENFPAGHWIKYFVSVDGGRTWARIAPIDTPAQFDGPSRVPTVIQVNSNIPDEAKDDRFGYLDPGTPARNAIVKIELSRPAEDIGGTPLVKRYELEILTRETTDQVL